MTTVAPVAAYDPARKDFVPAQQIDVARAPVAVGERVAIGAASTANLTAFPDGTRSVRVVSTVECFVAIAASPTAVVYEATYLPAGIPEYFVARPGDKVAVIQASIGGYLYARAFT